MQDCSRSLLLQTMLQTGAVGDRWTEVPNTDSVSHRCLASNSGQQLTVFPLRGIRCLFSHFTFVSQSVFADSQTRRFLPINSSHFDILRLSVPHTCELQYVKIRIEFANSNYIKVCGIMRRALNFCIDWHYSKCNVINTPLNKKSINTSRTQYYFNTYNCI